MTLEMNTVLSQAAQRFPAANRVHVMHERKDNRVTIWFTAKGGQLAKGPLPTDAEILRRLMAELAELSAGASQTWKLPVTT